MKTVVALTLSLVFTSCMHLGMMGTHADHQGTGSQTPPEPLLEKEVLSADFKATAIFPPLQMRTETVFTLKLTDVRTREPVSNARVSFHAAYLHKAEAKHEAGGHMMHTAKDSMRLRAADDHAVNFEQDVEESPEPGVYKVGFTGSQTGEYELMFHITAVGGQELVPGIVIKAERPVVSRQQHSAGMMHGMGSASEYLIIGGALMGAMMIVLWATGGRMF